MTTWTLARRTLAAFLAAGALAAPNGPSARAADAPAKLFTKTTTFRLPVQIGEADRARLKELRFFARKTPGAWLIQETAGSDRTAFEFKATGDGEYWFTFVTVDAQGVTFPASLDTDKPGLVVVVDTAAPVIESATAVREGDQVVVSARVTEANPDPAGLRVEIARSDSWEPVAAVADAAGVFRFAAPADATADFRVSVRDRAGNSAARKADWRAAPPAPIATTLPGAEPPLVMPESPAVAAAAPVTALKPAEAGPVPSSPLLLGTAALRLDYALEEVRPGSGPVEFWYTDDRAKTWKRLGDDPDRKSPAELTLPGEGAFGISARSGAAPAAGEVPDIWVEVDRTRPTVAIGEVAPGVGPDAGTVTIRWTATDANLAAEPVAIAHGPGADGPWSPVVAAVKNEGQYRWAVPPGTAAAAFVRLEVRDRAGNVTRVVTPQAVMLEVPKPKIRVIGVNPAQ